MREQILGTLLLFLMFQLTISKESIGMRELDDNWTLISSGEIEHVNAIHELDWKSESAHTVSVPNTVFGALVENGTFSDPFFGTKLREYDKSDYQESWIYRTVFDLDASLPSDFVELVFEGFNMRANVWLNGEVIGTSDELVGPFRVYKLDVTEVAQAEGNVLVVEILRPKPDDLTIGWVDWNAYPPDDNIGLWRPVKLRQTGKVSLDSVFVKTDVNLETLTEAELEISGSLANRTSLPVSGNLKMHIRDREFDYAYELQPNELHAFKLQSDKYSGLKMTDPEIWWPHHLGKQPLYELESTVVVGENSVSDGGTVRFGIREVAEYINEQGHRGWMVNGKKVLIRGGGWVDDLFLREDPERVRNQVLLTKHMNLNTIRLEGFWGSSKALFDACDEEGILLMIGWSCHWEWENYCGRPTDNYLLIKTPEDIAFQAQSFREQVEWLRNHPSIFTWVYGSDMLPRLELELALKKQLDEVDPTRPRLVGCRQTSQDGEHDFTSEISGPVAVKMVGPYSYVTPNYWYEDREIGGAFGFNTETGPGMVPTVFESVKKFTPESELWPLNDTWNFHAGRSVFASFDFWLPAFNARYGEADSAEDFCYRAQMSNYEALRAMFEAFAANRGEATGVIQWMLNSSLPNHLWQLYDYYLMPTGAFYGTQKACAPLAGIYDYHRKQVLLTNDTLNAQTDVEVIASVYDAQSKLQWEKGLEMDLPASSSSVAFEVPQELIEVISKGENGGLYFLDLRVRNKGEEVFNNFYWLSTEDDVCKYEDSNWHVTPNTAFANLTQTQELAESDLNVAHDIRVSAQSSDMFECEVTLENPTDQIAFFVELAVISEATHETLLPVFWEDNYISLLPGEKRTLKASFDSNGLSSEEMLLRVRGMNLETLLLKLP